MTIRVLTLCPELPSPDKPGSMAPTARQIESLRGLGVQMHVLDMRGIPKLKYLQAVSKVRAMAPQVDLVHAHFGYCGWLAKVQRSKPIVLSFMGSDLLGTPDHKGRLEWFSRVMIRANRILAPRVQAVIVKSEEMARVVDRVAAHVIPNGVDVAVFRPRDQAAARRELGWPIDGRYVLFPGNPADPRKGHRLASETMDRVRRRLGEDVELVLLWGVQPDRVAAYMNACDAMLMTSLIEGSPNVVKEAMACNLPVAAVPVGDVEALLAEVPGYAVCPRDPERLASAIVESMRKPQRACGREAIFDRELDLESVARRVLRVYEEILGRTAESNQEISQRTLKGSDKTPTRRASEVRFTRISSLARRVGVLSEPLLGKLAMWNYES